MSLASRLARAERPTFPMILVGLVILANAGVWSPAAALAADPVYRPKDKFPVLEEMTAAYNARKAARDSLRAAVDARYAAQAKAAQDTALTLRVDWSGIEAPAAPADFAQVWHNAPVAQYYTGTCWAFGSVSLLESEAARLAGIRVKLSEMWVVYWEYLAKARSFLVEYGHTPVEEGGQDVGTLEILREHGVVPLEAYSGVPDPQGADPQGRHDHRALQAELEGYLQWALDSGTIDLPRNLETVRSILDKHLGVPPSTATWQGRTYGPRDFASEVLRLDADQYVSCVSRMNAPFHTRVLLDVPDNWRRRDDYLNLPLDEFYGAIRKALTTGYSVSIGGDNSEPGMDGLFDKAIIPEWDIPAAYIDQGSREFRIVNGTTGDDHGVHLVGFLQHGGRDWFLIKDSNRSSWLGQHKGYYFWDGDYIKLKMLSFTVHKDVLGDLGD